MDDVELQQLVDDSARNLGIVGAQLCIFDGANLREFATGFRNLESQLPVSKDTLFQIGSTTKLFNAALVMSLVEDGKLALDAPVRDYIPNFRLADPNAEQSVTLRHLLSMSSGIDNGPYFDFGRGDDALSRYIDALSGVPQVFAPGAAFGYSNASTNVAGRAAACVSGKVWEELVVERIWKPLCLVHSEFFAENLLFRPVALGYKQADVGGRFERILRWSLPRSLGPAGGLACSSAGDVAKLARMFLEGGVSGNGARILSEESVDQIHQPHVTLQTRYVADEWCLGPYRKRWGDHVLYGHNGTNVSGSSMVVWCRDRKVAIATVVNVPEQGYPFAESILEVVLPQMFGMRRPRRSTMDDVVQTPFDMDRYTGRFESFGMLQNIEIIDGRLALTAEMAVAPQMNVRQCKLLALGDGRFLPEDRRASANRNWDMAFWGRNSEGKATHLLQGIFPLRRTAD